MWRNVWRYLKSASQGIYKRFRDKELSYSERVSRLESSLPLDSALLREVGELLARYMVTEGGAGVPHTWGDINRSYDPLSNDEKERLLNLITIIRGW
jgi:hypothetical protein